MAKDQDNFRGIEGHKEIKPDVMWRDPRSAKQKFSDSMGDPNTFLTMMGIIIAIYFIIPALGEIITIIGAWLIWFASKKEFKLPFRIPKTSGLLDPGQPNPANDEPSPAEGITFFGNERKTKKELWFNNSDMRTHVLIFGSTGAGKALRMTEKVHTPDGWKLNKDLKVGDLVSTPFGTSPIIGVYPQGELSLYKISFEDGREIEVSGDHLWEVHSKKWPSISLDNNTMANAKVLTTEELLKERQKNKYDNDYYILLSGEIEKPKQTLEISPHIASASFKDAIPLEYKNGSIEQRYQLIQSLMDVNGKIIAPSMVEYRTESRQFAEDLIEIIRSLGGVAKVNDYYVINTDKEEKTENFIINIQHPNIEKLFSLKDKKIDFKNEKSEHDLKLQITNVQILNKVENCQCIKIADKRGLFITKDYIVTHNTEALLSLAYNALVQGSGLIYVDGKGENVLYTKIFAMARTMSREDDVLVINYMTGSRDVFGPQEKKLSNTLNPFSSGSSGGLTELLVSLMDDGGSGGDMWKGRAISLISALMMALVYMRDNKEILLDVDAIREHLILDSIIKLYKTRRDFPNHIRSAIRAYLVSLPGFQESAPKQNDTVMEQHGYLQMQFTKLLGSLSDSYGFIFKTNLGEVDFKDVVLNRRILVVLLPALEKSTDELANLGKIIVACLKQMMASALGSAIEGSYADVVETKPTNSDMPFMTVLDEYGYYAVKGSAVMPAQARSLGFSMIFAGQDLPAFEKASKEEAASIVANCNIKICMKLEDPKDTYELFEKAASEALVTNVGRMELQQGGLVSTFRADNTASVESRKRINMLDLRDQREGEGHIIFKSAVIRAKMFYAAAPKPPYIRVNYFLRVEPPDNTVINQIDNGLKNLLKNLTNGIKIRELEENLEHEGQHIEKMRELLDTHSSLGENEASFATIAALGAEVFDAYDEKMAQFKNQLESDDDDEEEDHVTVFSHKERDEFFKERYGSLAKDDKNQSDDNDDDDDDDDDDINVFIDEEETRQSFENIEKIVGASDDEAKESASRTVEDMKKVSRYPSEGSPTIKEPEEIMDILHELDEMFDNEPDPDEKDN